LLLSGALGGWLFGYFGGSGVFICSAFVVLAWLILVLVVEAPKLLESRTVDLENAEQRDFSALMAQFQGLPGVREVILLPGENIAYLKVDPERFHNESLSHLGGIQVR
jgi:MFS family permease